MHDSPQSHRILSSDTAALWLLGLAFTAVHFVAGARYGFHRDELLTYSNARDLEWGYVVYPPVTAFLARIELAFFGTSLIGFRFFAAIASGFVAVLTEFMARAMGGGRQAMLVSAFAASIGGPVFFTGSFMSYTSVSTYIQPSMRHRLPPGRAKFAETVKEPIIWAPVLASGDALKTVHGNASSTKNTFSTAQARAPRRKTRVAGGASEKWQI